MAEQGDGDICAACGAPRREHTTPGGIRYGEQSLCGAFIPQQEDQPQIVKVACGHAGGLQLRLLDPEPGKEQAPGKMTSVVLQGPSAFLTGVQAPAGAGEVINEVDAEFWAEWLEQNRGKSPILTSGLIREISDEGKPNDRPAEPDRHL